MKLPKIIGVAGTNGSGKDTVGELLHDEKHYDFVSLSNILRQQLDEEGLPHSRENLSMMSKRIRDRDGDGGLSALTIKRFKESSTADGICITSIRTPGEVDAIHAEGGIVVWIDADERIRYERISASRRDRPEDQITFEQFIEQQQAEMTPTKQGNGLNMQGVKDKADVSLTNEFSSVDEFCRHVRDYFEF